MILVNQRASLPEWLPVLGADRFELKAEFSSAQAVTPGQGQSVDIAGIQIGDITGVELEDGHAVVTMEVDNEYGASDQRGRLAAAAAEDRASTTW